MKKSTREFIRNNYRSVVDASNTAECILTTLPADDIPSPYIEAVHDAGA